MSLPNCARNVNPRPICSKREYTMHIIKTFLCLVIGVLAVTASAKTIYSGEFDYRKFEPSSAYFSGRTPADIVKLCKTGEHAGTMDMSQCVHSDYEIANRNLEIRLKTLRSGIEADDKSLQADGEPLALPYFVKSQDAWVQYRDNYCYYDTYALDEASMRYMNFWDCMTRMTKKRLSELRKPETDD
jgi:uncharacterized protein YecT (DUF1311 family)